MKFIALILFVTSYGMAQPKVDETELHWSVCESSVQSIEKKLNINWKSPKQRDLSYYDELGSSLYQQGVILRVREKANSFKSIIKLRGLVENKIDWPWLLTQDYKCEWDQFGFDKKLSCSVKYEGVSGQPLFSAEQKELVTRMGPAITYKNLVANGPYKNHEYESNFDGYEFSLESVDLTKRIIFEVSTRVAAVDADAIYGKLTKEFQSQNLSLCKVQKGITAQLLDP